MEKFALSNHFSLICNQEIKVQEKGWFNLLSPGGVVVIMFKFYSEHYLFWFLLIWSGVYIVGDFIFFVITGRKIRWPLLFLKVKENHMSG